MALSNPIRPITQRLNLTAVHDLPRYASFLASSILNCAESIRHIDDQQSDTSVQVHKLVTRVTSLLQDKTQEGRYTGIVLVKSLVEAGGVQRLAASGSTWVRALLSCVNKHDPPEVKRLAVYTITRIFLLTRDHQSLVREITTPNLPSFVNACLNSIRPAAVTHGDSNTQLLSPLLEPVLQCWLQLLKAFPSTFRPFVTSIRTILLATLGDQTASSALLGTTSRVFAALHFAASRDSIASEWIQSCQYVIKAGHEVADLLFRSVSEDWVTNGSYQSSINASKKTASQVKAQTNDAVGLGKWSGIQTGCSRAIVLVNLLATLLTESHAQAVRIPLAEVLDLSARFAAVVKPMKTYALRENKEISRDERDDLFMSLSNVHYAIIDLHRLLAATFGQLLTPVFPTLLTQIWEIFGSERSSQNVRRSVYAAMTEVLNHGAMCLTSADTEQLATLIKCCCDDLESLGGELSEHSAHASLQNGDMNLQGGKYHQHLGTSIATRRTPLPELLQAAWNLIPIILSKVPQTLVSSKARANIDRSIILIGHQEAMLASVLNPLPVRHGVGYVSSIFPFLTRSGQQSLACEALLRPRQPVVQSASKIGIEEDERQIEVAPLQESALENSIRNQSMGSNVGNFINTPSEQLDAELSSQMVQDVPMVNKREHEGIRDAQTLDQEVPLKKLKVSQQPRKPSEESSEAETSLEVAESYEKSFQLAEVDHSMSEPATMVQAAEEKDVVGVLEQKSLAETAKQPTIDQNDDSDDSEIPQIDATLSCDDEDMDE